MKFYLFLCVSLTLAYRGFGRNLVLETETTLKPVENTVIANTESIFNSTENPVIPNEETSLTSTENTPISTPKSARPKCLENMRPFPLDPDENIWICLCSRPNLPLPMNNTCVKPFRQGPCNPGNIVIQPPGTGDRFLMEPKCITNTCVDDGLIFYNGTCRDIKINKVCDYGYPFFNHTVSEITCIFMPQRHRTAINAPARRLCPINSRPDRNGRCRRKL